MGTILVGRLAESRGSMFETVSSPYWLVFVMGIWVVACLGLGCKAIFFDSENPSQFDEK